ncbi:MULTISPECIES: translation initiation factor IF-3 [Thermus]|uniref:Translation initiation factor IF-3 n=4 Tax=Thermus thermophilus TaxID=274 RepID=IF3_THET8|nr:MULTISPECIES: translation initiation factor IF-3 [Thermus]Q5SKU2.2 RecName: Full=Translation initiation factor IF-3 [Thermus thermophilus HB8]Q70YI5.1 RecName: Full=Translation initiation factor IF-3 [Thermus thermophilus]Q9ACJ8.1 RecName: Full=Translation initiation factor IF-3 [Thermus thermophilus HB27]5LMN_X Chain X, Translation initiation factor IF-3 [Thermus thermophilus HB8]5LMO_X Chain X, Translation initiation factor IF-3 [Thermus thermophilus HB8]5LMP_X Chain X, Translation initi
MKEYLTNERIRAKQVRVVGPDGKQLGIMDTREALRLAQEMDLDLVLVGPNADPPVARIMDYSKWRYEQQMAEKEARKKAKRTEVKSIKFRVKIDEHDYQTKLGHIKRFLQEGHKVKVTIMFRGREVAHPELGERILNRVTEDLKDLAVVEMKPEMLGRDMNMLLAPVKVSA